MHNLWAMTGSGEAGSQSERQPPEPMRAQKRYLKARYVLQALLERKGRLLIALIGLALIFSAVAVVQHWFVHRHVYRTRVQELSSWAEEIADEVAYKDRWDLKGYRQATILAPTWSVSTRDGLIIDIEGLIAGIFGRVYAPDESIFTEPISWQTPVGENWRVFGRKLNDGYVVLGISPLDQTSDTDAKLRGNAAKFGSTLASAVAVRSREIPSEVDYAVVSSDGELKTAWGGVPLKVDISRLPSPSGHVARVISDGKPYLLYFRPILNTQHQSVGTIIVPEDMSLEEQALQSQDRFNLSIVVIAAVLAIVTALALIVRELSGQTKEATLEEALKVGESRIIEFKETFQWDVRQGMQNTELRLETLKSIAGFLNADGGTLFIGVAEGEAGSPVLRGISEDLKLMGGSRDKLQRALRDLITTRIGPQFSPFISDRFENASDFLYWVVVVEESLREPAFVRWKAKGESKEQTRFFVREGPKTSDLDNERTWHYIRNKWGR
jgi:hypothetical protein